MLNIIKRSERNLKASDYFKAIRTLEYKINDLGEYDKWKDLSAGGRLQVKVEVYEIKDAFGKIFYAMVDNFGFFMNQFTEDKESVFNWLKEHGYKVDKQWYLEDYGMTEEAWEEWNK